MDQPSVATHKLDPNKWIDKYSDYLFNYAIVRVNNHDLAKDLVQETFFAGLKSAKNFEGKSTERTWLISILKRKIIDYYRKINSKKGQAEVRMNFYEDGENEGSWIEERVPQSWENEAEKKIESVELHNQIDDCIDHLPESCSRILVYIKLRINQVNCLNFIGNNLMQLGECVLSSQTRQLVLNKSNFISVL